MLKMNDLMNEIIKSKQEDDTGLLLESTLDEIVYNTKIIRDYIIYDKGGMLKEEKINFKRIISFYGDGTGYEVSCNEFRYERKNIPQSQYVVLASRLSDMLSLKFNGRKIVVYILLYDNEIELRFHTYRKDEGLWLDNDLNKYDTPILYWI